MALACMLSVSQTGFGQKVSRDEWRKQVQAQEETINDYVSRNLNNSNHESLLKQFYASIHPGEVKATDLPKLLDAYLRNHYREQYLKENPKVLSIYNPGRISLEGEKTYNAAAAANITNVACFNGDFESDPSLSSYTGFRGPTYFGNECTFVPTGPVAYTPISLFTNPNEFQLTNNVADPMIPGLMQTNNGSAHAIRINGPGPCAPGAGINMLHRTFVTPTAGMYRINFSYALVMENPKGHGNLQPFFVARVLNGAGVEVGSRICRVSDLTNPIYNISGYRPNPTGCTTTDSLVWRDWTCASISFQGDPSQTYTIEFFQADCAAGGHFGYAYVDDICASECCPKFFMRDCCDMHGGSSSGATGRPAQNTLVDQVLADYNQRMNAKYNLAANAAAVDPCCNPCAYPNDPYPVFIMDEFNNLISSTDYVITWSHDPGNSSAYAFILPNQQTIITVKGPGNCVWTDTLKLNCCNETIKITPFCTWDPCQYPTSPFPVRVLDHNGNPLTTSAGYTFLWQYGPYTSTGDAITTTLANFPVIVTVRDANCEYTDTLDINCCRATAPENLKCREERNGSHLFWDAVPGAHYQVIMTVNDPDCCGDQGPRPYTIVWDVAGTDTIVPISVAYCFSWKVIAICPDGTKSPDSKKMCSCSPVVRCDPKTPDNLNCREIKNGSYLSWDPILNAKYKVYINVNDPDCCGDNGTHPYTIVWNVTGTDTIIPASVAYCFSWYVTSVCPDGKESDPSYKKCSCTPIVDCEPKKPEDLKCERTDDGSFIYWTPVPNAYYKVFINVNDPKCCRSSNPGYSMVWTVYGNDTVVPVSTANCFSWYVVSVCPGGRESEPSELSCSCSPIITNLCDDPYKLKCSAVQNGAQLSWAIPAGAGGYELELTYNDPNCCITTTPPTMALIGLGTNSYFVPGGFWKCFSWRVRSKCNAGGYSNWVYGGCNCSAVSATVSPTARQDNSGNNSGVGAFAGKDVRVEAVPNPASDFVEFTLKGAENLQNQSLEMSICDITGREVARKAVNADAKVKMDVYSLAPGLYIYKLKGNGELIYSGKIMIDRK